MRSLFEYDSYRRFLADFFRSRKEASRSFSYRSFARKAGFSSCGFCHQVVSGDRNLTPEASEKMILGLGISGRRAEYFKALVRYEQSERKDEKEKAWAEVNHLRKDSAFFRANRSHWRYYEHWWLPVLRNLVVHAPWGGDLALLAELVDPPITEAQARQGVALLEELDLVERDPSGRWRQTTTLLSSADIPAEIKVETRSETLRLGLESLTRHDPSVRHASYYTLGLRRASYLRLLEKIEELNTQAATLAADDQDVDRVYELAVLLYPLSKPLGKRP
ncbi:MAG: TIGR02147 family protein [Fibrobacteria bacterium]|nr:TIGR02147 family protein [Fibrobacteria bacterium]